MGGFLRQEIQVLRRDCGTSCGADCLEDGVFQLSHIAVEAVIFETFYRRRVDAFHCPARLLRCQTQELLYQKLKVVEPIPKRWQGKCFDRQTVVEIGAEPVFSDFVEQIAVGGRDDSNVKRNRFDRADSFYGPIVEHAEQLDLRVGGQFADLIQKKRTAVGRFENAFAVGMGIGECTADMPEKLAFDESFRQGAAVDRDERSFTTAAIAVDCPGGKLFACAGFAL